jgi:hypothetical protein
MKKTIIVALAAFSLVTANTAVAGGGVAAYGTYWDGENPGYGVGAKYAMSLIDIIFADARAGYIMFDDAADTTMVPLEISFNLGLPGAITHYAGVGLGYYLIDNPILDDSSGYFGQIGLEFTIIKIGAMVELRYMDLESNYFDDLSLNAGLVFKF